MTLFKPKQTESGKYHALLSNCFQVGAEADCSTSGLNQTQGSGKILALKSEPRPPGVLKLKGYDRQYRLRVGDYRVRYEVFDEELTVQILQCKHRREVYRDKG